MSRFRSQHSLITALLDSTYLIDKSTTINPNCSPLGLRELLGGNKSKQKWMTMDFINSKTTIRKTKKEHKKAGKSTQNQKHSSKGKRFSANNNTDAK